MTQSKISQSNCFSESLNSLSNRKLREGHGLNSMLPWRSPRIVERKKVNGCFYSVDGILAVTFVLKQIIAYITSLVLSYMR